jgi:hypothetical protein
VNLTATNPGSGTITAISLATGGNSGNSQTASTAKGGDAINSTTATSSANNLTITTQGTAMGCLELLDPSFPTEI